MEQQPKHNKKRQQHLRVPVFSEEKEQIEANAKAAGVSVAHFLREVGQGYQVQGITDYERVRELARINGDLGRMGGLLKLWLTDDVRKAVVGSKAIYDLLAHIDKTQSQMAEVMKTIVRPKAAP